LAGLIAEVNMLNEDEGNKLKELFEEARTIKNQP